MLKFSEFPDKKYDAAIFYESFHHCKNPLAFIKNLSNIIKDEGIICFAAEPFIHSPSEIIPYPWGIRLDGMSVWSIRKFGWMEIGFDINFFKKMLSESGFISEQMSSEVSPLTNLIIARKVYRGMPGPIISNEYMVVGKNCCVHIDNGWNNIEKWDEIGSIRWTKKNAKCFLKPQKTNNLLIINYYSAFNDFEFKVIIIQNTRIIAEYDTFANLGWNNSSYELPEISCDPLAIEFLIKKSWIPQQMGINADGRELGIAIHEIKLI